jgi:NitT/TauT family transport system permease protein
VYTSITKAAPRTAWKCSTAAATRSFVSAGRQVIGLRILFGVVALLAWEAYGRFVDDSLSSMPSAIAVKLGEWVLSVLWYNLGVTLFEIGCGLLIGVPAGIVLGLLVGRRRVLGAIVRPLIFLFYSIPFIALAPLLIMWFGVGPSTKVLLIGLSSFFLIFFNTFAGAQAVEADWIATIDIMGATARERFFKVIAPACIPWIMSGLKTVLPFSLIGATIGEMLASKAGLGNLLVSSSSNFDMAGFYAALVLLMVLGALLNEAVQRMEGWFLRWRDE